MTHSWMMRYPAREYRCRFHHGGHRVHGERRQAPDRAQRPGVRRFCAALPPRLVSPLTQKVRRCRRRTDYGRRTTDDGKPQGGNKPKKVMLNIEQGMTHAQVRKAGTFVIQSSLLDIGYSSGWSGRRERGHSDLDFENTALLLRQNPVGWGRAFNAVPGRGTGWGSGRSCA